MRQFISIIEQRDLAESGAGPARIVSHIKSGNPFFIISAMRTDLSKEENRRRTLLLRSHLARAGALSFIDIEGEFQEHGQDHPTTEESFFVLPRSSKTNTHNFISLGEKLMHVFGQDAIIVGDGFSIFLVEKDGTTISLGNAATFRLDQLRHSLGSSKIKHHGFTFTHSADVPNSVVYGRERKSA